MRSKVEIRIGDRVVFDDDYISHNEKDHPIIFQTLMTSLERITGWGEKKSDAVIPVKRRSFEVVKGGKDGY